LILELAIGTNFTNLAPDVAHSIQRRFRASPTRGEYSHDLPISRDGYFGTRMLESKPSIVFSAGVGGKHTSDSKTLD
jgi:hypothetical protein